MKFAMSLVVLSRAEDPSGLVHVLLTPRDDAAAAFNIWGLAPKTVCGKESHPTQEHFEVLKRCQRCDESLVFMNSALAVLERVRERLPTGQHDKIEEER